MIATSPLYQPSKRARRDTPPLYAGVVETTASNQLRTSRHWRPSPAPTPRPELGDELPALRSVREYLTWLWSFEECRICERLGPCLHREPEVDMARAAAWAQELREVVA